MMGIGFQGIVTACITPDLSDNPFVQKNAAQHNADGSGQWPV
jgi:hypothetical protein